MTDLPPPTDPQLERALNHSLGAQKRLNRLTVIAALVLAFLLSMMIANQNVYSVLLTFVFAVGCFIAASIYQRSLALLIPLIAIYCVLDNYLSHDFSFHQKRFLLQFGSLIVFSAIFHLSRPYLFKVLRNHPVA